MIGVFDSGFGGLTVLREVHALLPDYNTLYLGDSARAPYGNRSLEIVTHFTREAAEFLFNAGCALVILACNTASAQALRTLQQRYLPLYWPDRRILGVVRPSAESLAELPPGAIPGVTPASNASGTVAVLGTTGTIQSGSYRLELAKLAPRLDLIEQACPMLVPLVEAGELTGPGTEYFLHKYLDPLLFRFQPPTRILLGCTHYPLLLPSIRSILPASIEVISQGRLVATRLADWLVRHPEIEQRLSRGSDHRFVTTEDPDWFREKGEPILERTIHVDRVHLRSLSRDPV